MKKKTTKKQTRIFHVTAEEHRWNGSWGLDLQTCFALRSDTFDRVTFCISHSFLSGGSFQSTKCWSLTLSDVSLKKKRNFWIMHVSSVWYANRERVFFPPLTYGCSLSQGCMKATFLFSSALLNTLMSWNVFTPTVNCINPPFFLSIM